MSNDLRRLSKDEREILQNRVVIDINQDLLGIMAKRVQQGNDNIEVFVKPIWGGGFAVAYFNKNSLGSGIYVDYPLSSLLPESKTSSYTVINVYDANVKIMSINDTLELKVNPSGVNMVVLYPFL